MISSGDGREGGGGSGGGGKKGRSKKRAVGRGILIPFVCLVVLGAVPLFAGMWAPEVKSHLIDHVRNWRQKWKGHSESVGAPMGAPGQEAVPEEVRTKMDELAKRNQELSRRLEQMEKVHLSSAAVGSTGEVSPTSPPRAGAGGGGGGGDAEEELLRLANEAADGTVRSLYPCLNFARCGTSRRPRVLTCWRRGQLTHDYARVRLAWGSLHASNRTFCVLHLHWFRALAPPVSISCPPPQRKIYLCPQSLSQGNRIDFAFRCRYETPASPLKPTQTTPRGA